jgi:uncharacterized protein YceH (UPF0502 family)
MDILLNDVEGRIIGCLIEKGITTPDYYPLTLNTLTNACNQKSNRNPVVSFEETTVVRGLESLQQQGLTEKIIKADSRVPKYRHSLDERLDLSPRELAVLCVLMLRGPQTVGEIRGRTERMYKFAHINEVDEVLTGLMERDRPLAVKLVRQTGQKEQRFAHLLSGEPEVRETERSVSEEAAAVQVRAENERIQKLEEELAALRSEFDTLRQAFMELKSQFD